MFRRFLRPVEPGHEDPASAAPAASTVAGETDTVRRIVARLDALPPERARYLAGFAYVMSRAAQADLDISDAETKVMEEAVVEAAEIDAAQAVLVVQMAKLQARTRGATEDYLVTREFAKMATDDQKLAVLRCCFAVGAADGSISAAESSVVNEIARELGIGREQLNDARSAFVEQLSAIQAMRRMHLPE